MFQPRLILHPTDYSEHSAYAFRIAADLAVQNGATVLVLHVAETLGPEYITYGEAVTQREPDAYRQRLEAELRRRVPAPADVPVQYLLTAGDPAPEIIRVARERGCDLIVMGTHTHGRAGLLDRLFVDHVAQSVIRDAPCPVLTSKLPAGAVSTSR